MLKFTSLAFLVAAVIFSPNVDAKPLSLTGHHRSALKYVADIAHKREINEETVEFSSESEEAVAKRLVAGLLLLTVDSSAEVDKLELEYRKAVEREWDSFDDYANHLFKVYEEVTGKKPDDRK